MVRLKSYEAPVDPYSRALELTAVDTLFHQELRSEQVAQWIDRIVLATGDLSGNTVDEIAVGVQ